jgi:hypothetical protein
MAEKPEDEKLSHRAVKYERPSAIPAHHCGNCEYIIETMTPRCEIVASPIYLNGWCEKWEKK